MSNKTIVCYLVNSFVMTNIIITCSDIQDIKKWLLSMMGRGQLESGVGINLNARDMKGEVEFECKENEWR